MNTLHLFGDSFTEGHLLDKTFPSYRKWEECRGGNLPPCWGDLLSAKLNMNMSNRAIAGMSNVEIFQTICKHSNEFEKNDIVIVNWTYRQRFRWAYLCDEHKIYKWRRFSANREDGSVISEQTRFDVAFNKELPLYVEEIYEYEKLLYEYSKSKGFKIFFWSCDINIINNLSSEMINDKKYLIHDEIEQIPLEIPKGQNDHSFVRADFKRTIFDVFFKYGGTTIYDETNGVVGDGHLGEKGHRVQYELFYKYIIENTLI